VSLQIVQLGSPRKKDEGLRIGTVRRPPRGVPKGRYAADDWYDVWLPNLSPSHELIETFKSDPSPRAWDKFSRRFRREMAAPENSRVLDMLAALSHSSNFSIGCYCSDENHCHRRVLRELFLERGARIG
jgi:uncharacterized protein YeaO (DUF488 family)